MCKQSIRVPFDQKEPKRSSWESLRRGPHPGPSLRAHGARPPPPSAGAHAQRDGLVLPEAPQQRRDFPVPGPSERLTGASFPGRTPLIPPPPPPTSLPCAQVIGAIIQGGQGPRDLRSHQEPLLLRGAWALPWPQRHLLWLRAPRGPGPGAAGLPTPAVRNGILGRKTTATTTTTTKWFSVFVQMETKSRRSCHSSPLSAMRYLDFSFFIAVFVFGPGDGPADSPGSDLGGVCITPFYLYKKKKWVENCTEEKKCTFL